MKLEYRENGLILRQLNESSTNSVLDFYYRNKDYFDIYEADKPANFYTTGYISSLLHAEYNAFVQKKFVRFFAYDQTFPDKIIGTVSFSDIKTGPGACKSCIIGYKIDHEMQRHGYGYKMLNAALKIMVMDWEMHRIEAYISPNNLASQRLVDKLGFISEGTAYSYVKLNGIWRDHLRYTYIS